MTTTTLALLSWIDTSKFADDDIDTNDESKRSGGKSRLSKITEENNGDIGKGWAKEKVSSNSTPNQPLYPLLYHTVLTKLNFAQFHTRVFNLEDIP